MNYPALRFSFLLYLIFVVACSEPEKPVTKEEATRVAALVTNAMANRNAGKFNELLDLEALKKRVVQQAETKINKSMLEGAMQSMASGTFARQIVKSLGEHGTYELVKQYEKDNRQHLVFRLYNDQLNYHDLELIKKRNEIKVADIYVYTTGETFSSTLAQSLLALDEKAALRKIGKAEVDKVKKIRDYINEEKYAQADELFQSLPASIRAQKLYKLIYIQIASGLGNDLYLATLEKFRREYPDAPNLYLLMIDAYFLKQDYAGAIRCIDGLDSLISKDIFLDYYRALMYKSAEDQEHKMICLERLHRNMPAFGAGTLELINAYVEDKQWEKAIPLTLQYRKTKDVDIETLESLYLLYPDFRKKLEAAGT